MPPFPRKRTSTGTFATKKRGTLKDHLAAATDFARLAEQARRLQRLQNLLDAVLPPELSPGTQVANIKRGKVVIHAASGAVAVKLRQLSPRLAENFIQQGQEVTGIEVRVQAHRGGRPVVRQKVPKELGSRSKQALTSLAAGLAEDSPVRQALLKLLKNSAP